MKEMLIDIFTHPLAIGLCIGLIACLIVWLRSLGKLRSERSAAAAQANRLNQEINTLKGHLHTQMEITAKGNESLKEELVALQKTNQNLSQTIGALKQKPGRVEIRTLHLYEKAIRTMNARAPGFSSAWESAINEAEAEIKQEESGIIGWIRKPFMFRSYGSTELLGDAEKVTE
ncbi:MAG TPA: hypothetical protein DEA90_15265 [Opitutae bacterium]|nr:hypothetical protein [Puniceicoccaceae bacterium]HBR95520.1 hypothetical protein [Opitutae bacterium]|tara:strand:- start:1388 stop:1909 length:522 start_codon:yes stop_codon:yes gene_type:complete